MRTRTTPGLVGHVQHHFVQAGAIVVQHVMRSAAAQHFALLLGADQRRGFQMLAMQSRMLKYPSSAKMMIMTTKIETISLALTLRPSRCSQTRT